MNSKTYSVYANNTKNNDQKLYNIENLVVGNILTCTKKNKSIMYESSPVKYIFEKSHIEGKDIYREALSNTELKEFSINYDGPYISNIENLTDYINIDMLENYVKGSLLNCEDILDMQEAVNMIYAQENKNKLNKKSL